MRKDRTFLVTCINQTEEKQVYSQEVQASDSIRARLKADRLPKNDKLLTDLPIGSVRSYVISPVEAHGHE